MSGIFHSTVDPNEALLNLVREAAVQRRFMRSRLADLKAAAQEKPVLYAVDMDVIRMYANPAADNSGRIPYGRVFKSDTDEVAEALSLRLVDHIFFKLSGTGPLLVIPPVEAELERYVYGMVSRMGNKPATRHLDVERLDGLLGDLSLPADEANREALQEAASRVQELLFYEQGESAEFRRMDQLLRDGRIAGPESPDYLSRLEPDVAQMMRPFDSLTQVVRHYDLTMAWTERLHKAGHRGRRAQTDAGALARLEMWNDQLSIEGRRLVYITGSRALFEAGWAYTLPGAAGTSVSSFADFFLRHPRAFIDEPGVLDTSSGPTTGDSALQRAASEHEVDGVEVGEFSKLLLTFLATFDTREEDLLDQQDRFGLSAHARTIVTKTAAQQEDLGPLFLGRWSAFTQAMRPAYQPPKAVEDRLLEMFQNANEAKPAYQRWQAVEDRIVDLIETATRKAWDRCFRMAVRTGYAFVLNDYWEPPRSVPPLNFDSWKSTHRFIDMVSRWHASAQVDFDAYDTGLAAVDKDDPSGYAHYLVHAALFAGRGMWDVAAMLAAKALERAKEESRTPGRPNGREAAYLLSVCRRHSAKRIADLQGLESLVELAIEIYNDENKAKSIEAIPERFQGELLAIELTRLMFERFGAGEQSGAGTGLRERWASARDRLLSALLVLSTDIRRRIVIAETALANADQVDSSAAAKLTQTLRKLELRTLTNALSLMLVDGDPVALRENEIFGRVAASVKGYHPKQSDTGPEVSFFVRVVADCAAVILEREPRARRILRAEFVKELSLRKIEANAVFPYDLARLQQFRETVMNMA